MSMRVEETLAGSSASRLDGGADEGEGAVGVRPEAGDGRDANDDDQGEHDRILDRCRAVFLLEKLDQALRDGAHFRNLDDGGGESNREGDRTLRPPGTGAARKTRRAG